MKKYFLFIVFITICMQNISFAAKPKVVATASMLSDMVKNIGGDYFEVVSIRAACSECGFNH